MKTNHSLTCKSLAALFLLAAWTPVIGAPAVGPLRVHPTNPRYFTDGTKQPDGSFKAVYLTGSHTWGNAGAKFDFPAYLDFLEHYHHNFIRLWSDEGVGSPYLRTGPGTANDGGLKVDLDKLDPAFFERLRSRVIAARDRGIYVGIVLFAADGARPREQDWKGLLFNPANNVQGINSDTNKDGSGAEAYDLSIPRITALQELFARKVVDAVNDLDNVLYEIGNEGDVTSIRWQYHFIRLIQSYEAGKPKQHPIGMSAVFHWLDKTRKVDNRALFQSRADWISPADDGTESYKSNPPAADGRKIIVADVDHIWPAAPPQAWIWKCFLRGLHPIHMDMYTYSVTLHGISKDQQEVMRKYMGYTLTYADKMNLAAMTPRNELASTKYCLANPGKEYLVYQPKSGETFSVGLKAGTYRYEWFDPGKGATAGSGNIAASGKSQQFKAPFQGESVIYFQAQSK